MDPAAVYYISFVFVFFLVLIICYVVRKNKEDSEQEYAYKHADFKARIQNPTLEEPYKKLKEFFVKHGVINTDNIMHPENYYTLKRWHEIASEIAQKSTEQERVSALYQNIPSQLPTPAHFLKAYNINTEILRKKLGSCGGLIRAFDGIHLTEEDVTETTVGLCFATQKMERENSGDDVSIFRFNYEVFILSLLVDYLFDQVEPSLGQRDALRRIKEYANENSDIRFDYDTDEELHENEMRLLGLCEQFIDKYEAFATSTLVPTAKYDLMKRIRKQVEADDEIPTWEKDAAEYDKIANVLLANASFDLLASGNYHIHAGTLNPMNCSSKMMAVYNGAMRWSVENGYNDEKTRQEQYDYLLKCISEVG